VVSIQNFGQNNSQYIPSSKKVKKQRGGAETDTSPNNYGSVTGPPNQDTMATSSGPTKHKDNPITK